MSTSTFSHFVAILSLLAWAGTLTTIALAIVRKVAPASAAARLFDDIGASALWLAWIVAAVTMAGSLYYSLGPPQFVPCELCWYQRICLYPQAAILLVAALRRDRKVWTYVVPVLVVGAAIAIYHVQLQAYPKQQTFCPTLTPCTTRYVWEFGFVSLPFMSLAASCFIITMVLVSRSTDPDRYDDEDDGDELAASGPSGDRGRADADADTGVTGSNPPGESHDTPSDQVGAV
jgi:disulfide bond formation protein DsbB